MPKVITWNMQGAKHSTEQCWTQGVGALLKVADYVCLQECGTVPSSAQPWVPPFPPPAGVTFWTWEVSRKGAVYIVHVYWGQRVSTAVVSKSAPTAATVLFPAVAPIKRGALGMTSAISPDWVFTLHAISPNGPDAPGLLTAIQAACGAASWIAAGDFNCEPAIAGFNCIDTDRYTWKTDDPKRTLDWCATSAPVGNNIGEVSGLYMSDHYPVLFDL